MSGYRTWTPGEVLTASNVQNYLQDQSVMVFASSAARSSAIVSPDEGMLTYLSDNNTIQYYDGAAWNTIFPTFSLPITVTSGATAAVGKIFVFNPASGTPTGASSGDLWIW